MALRFGATTGQCLKPVLSSGEPPRRRECTGPRGTCICTPRSPIGSPAVAQAHRYGSLAMADLRLLGPYITEVLEVVGGSPCFANLESERPGGQKIAVLVPL